MAQRHAGLMVSFIQRRFECANRSEQTASLVLHNKRKKVHTRAQLIVVKYQYEMGNLKK